MNETLNAAKLTFLGFTLLTMISLGWYIFQESRRQAELKEYCAILEAVTSDKNKPSSLADINAKTYARSLHHLECPE